MGTSVLTFLKSAMTSAGYNEVEFQKSDDQELLAKLMLTVSGHNPAQPNLSPAPTIVAVDTLSELFHSFHSSGAACNPAAGVVS